jgi:TonB family protein
MGNDRPLSIVMETWKSPELQLVVLSIRKHPQLGERTQKLLNIIRTEPPAALFQPPPDFTVVDDPVGNGPTSADGVFRIGGDVSAPAVISKIEPQYSQEALHAKLSGAVLLSIVVGEDGLPRDIRVVRPLGFGLDEKAIEAVMAWRFQPGMKDGHPVPVRAQVQVNFRLLDKKP